MGIRGRVYGGFAVVLAILILVAGIAAFSFARVSGQVGQFARSAASSEAIGRIDRGLLALDALIQSYSDDGAEALLAPIAAKGAEIMAAIDAQREAAGRQEADQLGAARTLLDDYMAGFAELRTKKSEQIRLVAEQLLPLGADLVTRLDAASTQAMGSDTNALSLSRRLLQRLLEVRLVGERSIGKHDEQSRAAIQDAVDSLESGLRAFEQRAAANVFAGAKVVAGVRTYLGAFHQIDALGRDLNAIATGRMHDRQAALSGKLSAMVAAATATEAGLQRQSILSARRAELIVLGISAAGLLLGGLAAWIIGGGVSSAIRAITRAMTELAAGNKAVDLEFRNRGDEIGDMARALLVFRDTAAEADRLAADHHARLELREQRRERMEDTIRSFDQQMTTTLDQLLSSSGGLREAAAALRASADRNTAEVGSAADACTQADLNIQTVAAAAEQMTASISEIGRQVEQSTLVTSQAVTDASDTSTAMAQLRETAGKIGDIVTLISEIAAQTNLLALNATIEAARAGDAGKGFAVVASEVKSLASQTAHATEQISRQVQSIQATTAATVTTIEHIVATIGTMSSIATSIVTAVEQQSAATREIVRNVSLAAQQSRAAVGNFGSVQAAAQSTGVTAAELFTTSASLAQGSARMRQDVDGFMDAIRAA